MEAKVVFNDGNVETYRIPDYVGSSHISSEDFGGSETLNEIDRVRSVVERFKRDAEGFWIEQEIDKPLDVRVVGDRLAKGKGKVEKRVLVVSNTALGTVRRIDVDGEQVYPELEEPPVASGSYLGASSF